MPATLATNEFFLTDEYAECVYAGVLGKMIGVYLGRPIEGWTRAEIEAEFGEIEGYVHEARGVPLVVTDDDIAGTFGFLRAVEDFGFPAEPTPQQIGETWRNLLIEGKTVLWWGGIGVSTEHTAFLRLDAGIPAPKSGSIALNGRTVAEQIGAQIFIDGWGMLNPDDPARAADLARRAASVSHDGEAIHGAQVVAAMVAAAFTEPDPARLVETALSVIPPDSLIARLIRDLQGWHAEGLDWREAYDRLEPVYGYGRYGGGCHTVPNHALVILALLWSEGSFDLGMTIANTLGWDTDCNAGNVGCILAIAGGLESLEGRDWRGPVADRLYISAAEGGRTVSDAVRETDAIVNAARRIRNLEGYAPKRGARFHWTYPGAVQGWGPQGGKGSVTPVLTGIEVGGKAQTPTWLSPEDLKITEGYIMVASPTLYPGQKVRASLVGSGRLFVRAHGAEDPIYGPDLDGDGEWTIPETPGLIPGPIWALGFEGSATLDRLDWRGTPNVDLHRTTPAELAQWASSCDEVGAMIRKDHGLGLAAVGDRTWSDVAASATLTRRLPCEAGLVLRFQGLRRHYAFVVGPDEARIERMAYGREILASCPIPPFASGETLGITATAKADRLTLSLNGETLLEAGDATFATGGAGFIVRDGAFAADSLKIRPS